MRKIIVIGSSNTDMVIQSDKLPRPGETVLGGRFYMSPGGKGGNQAVAIARMGAPVYFVAKVGDDVFGKQAIENYRNAGVDVKYISISEKEASGIALIMVDSKAENCISVAGGANYDLNPKDIEQAIDAIEPEDIVLLQLEIPIATVLYAIDAAYERGAKVVLNPAPAAMIPREYLRKVFLLTPNQREAEMLTDMPIDNVQAMEIAMDKLHDAGVEIVVMTLGADGSLLSHRDTKRRFEARKVNPIDTVGAGDTFNGALCVALFEGKSIEEAIHFATLVSSISVTRQGAQTSIPTRDEVESYLFE